MEDLIDQLRDQRLQQAARLAGGTIQCTMPPKSRRSEYTRLHTRLRAGLVGSIVLMLAVACLMPLFVHHTGYLVCYIVVQLITVVRVLIAIQMNITLRHIDPSRSVSEVAAYVDRLELIHQWDRRYTLYIKVPLTICVIALLLPVVFGILWANGQSPLPIGILLLIAGVPVIVIVCIVTVLIQRIKEIKGGEEDEAAQY